jgi:hypothetical protein
VCVYIQDLYLIFLCNETKCLTANVKYPDEGHVACIEIRKHVYTYVRNWWQLLIICHDQALYFICSLDVVWPWCYVSCISHTWMSKVRLTTNKFFIKIKVKKVKSRIRDRYTSARIPIRLKKNNDKNPITTKQHQIIEYKIPPTYKIGQPSKNSYKTPMK